MEPQAKEAAGQVAEEAEKSKGQAGEAKNQMSEES